MLQEDDQPGLADLADSMRASAERLRAMSQDAPKPSQIEIAPQGTMTTIDLSKHANWGNTECWGDSYHGNGLAELPKGDQVLCGVKFSITEKMMQLGYDRCPMHRCRSKGFRWERSAAGSMFSTQRSIPGSPTAQRSPLTRCITRMDRRQRYQSSLARTFVTGGTTTRVCL